MNQSDEFEISVEVCDPKVIPGINKYVAYTLRGMDKNGQFDVQRRFSDFKTIRLFLVSKWPGCYIPPIPPRKAFVLETFIQGNMEQQFIDERMKMLQDFLRKIATLKYLWYAEEFQVFLKSQGELEKALQSIPKVTNEEIMNKYQDTFTDLSGVFKMFIQREINREVVQKINDFHAFIRKVQPMIENFKQIAKNIEEAKSAHQQSLIHFILTFIPEYENNILLEYTESEDKLIFGKMAKQEQMQELVNYVMFQRNQNLQSSIRRFEGKAKKAFVQTFQEREKYELQKLQAETKQKDLQIQLQEILAGKTTLKTLFTSTKKEDQIAKIQQQIETVGKEIENFQFICDILTVLVGYIEIDRFKVEKQVQYYQMMKGIIEYEIRLANITEEFWSTVLKSENLQQQQ